MPWQRVVHTSAGASAVAKKPKPVKPGSAEEAAVMEMVADRAEWGDAEARLNRMERLGRDARANKDSRLFRPLVRVPEADGGVTWRTPYAIRRYG